MDNKQIGALTATRGFAAMLIVIFHFGLNCFPFDEADKFFSKGNLAVSYFFTLSGFIMCYTYSNRGLKYADYLKRRIGRIVPLYLFAVLLAAIILVYQSSVEEKPIEAQFALKLLLNITLLQAYIPGYALSVNSPGWSLSVEMFFYFLFPVLLWLYHRHKRAFLVSAVLFYVCSQCFHISAVYLLKPQYGTPLHEFIYYHPIVHLNEFIVGMTGYALYQNRNSKMSWLSPTVLFAITVLAMMYVMPSKHNGLLAPLYMLFIVAIALQEKNLLNIKPLVYLGDISYGIYILQMPVYFIVSEFNKNILHTDNAFSFLLYVMVLIAVSALCYTFIEKPLRKKINALKL